MEKIRNRDRHPGSATLIESRHFIVVHIRVFHANKPVFTRPRCFTEAYSTGSLSTPKTGDLADYKQPINRGPVLTNYAPVIYTRPCIMFWRRGYT